MLIARIRHRVVINAVRQICGYRVVFNVVTYTQYDERKEKNSVYNTYTDLEWPPFLKIKTVVESP